MSHPLFYLASASPRRRELLGQLGLTPTVLRSDIDETPLPNEPASDYTLRLAQEKAAAGWKIRAQQGLAEAPLLASDTTVALHNAILGKPDNTDDAKAMLARLSGGQHEVYTAIAITDGQRTETRLSTSTVTFRTLSAAEIDAYVATGEPMDKAGSYGIQGIAGIFVAHMEGSYTGIMGLPIYETAGLLADFGIVVLR